MIRNIAAKQNINNYFSQYIASNKNNILESYTRIIDKNSENFEENSRDNFEESKGNHN